jgi:hypothetical protein
LTAVVRGAALCGIEKLTTKNLSKASACRRHYAICVNQQFSEIMHDPQYLVVQPKTNQMLAIGQLVWLFTKGDLIISDKPKVAEFVITTTFNKTDDRKGKLRIYSYDDDDRPERIQNAMDGMH